MYLGIRKTPLNSGSHPDPKSGSISRLRIQTYASGPWQRYEVSDCCCWQMCFISQMMQPGSCSLCDVWLYRCMTWRIRLPLQTDELRRLRTGYVLLLCNVIMQSSTDFLCGGLQLPHTQCLNVLWRLDIEFAWFLRGCANTFGHICLFVVL